MGTAFGLRIVAAVAMIILTVMSVSMLKTYADDIALKQLVYILSFGLLFQSFEIVDYFFSHRLNLDIRSSQKYGICFDKCA